MSNDDANEIRVTLRLPTVVDVEIAPMAIVRWLIANRWNRCHSRHDGIAIFRMGDDWEVSFPVDPTYSDIKRRVIEAIQRLAAIANVEPHVMAARIIAADGPVATTDPFATLKARIEGHAFVHRNGEALFKAELFAAFGLTGHQHAELAYEFARAHGQCAGDIGTLNSFVRLLPMMAAGVAKAYGGWAR
jgi:hypothetical protein